MAVQAKARPKRTTAGRLDGAGGWGLSSRVHCGPQGQDCERVPHRHHAQWFRTPTSRPSSSTSRRWG